MNAISPDGNAQDRGAPDRDLPGHGTSDRRAPDQGTPDHGPSNSAPGPDHGAAAHSAPESSAPDHSTPDHGAPDHGAPDHSANRALVSPGDRYGARLGHSSSAAALQAQLIRQETINLAEAFQRLVAAGTVPRAAAATVAARRRFVTGAGKSFAYASLLATDLSAALSHVTLVDGAIVRPLDLLSEVRGTDVLIAFSFRRYRKETIQMATEFHRSGGTVIAVTDDDASPLVPIATESIVVPTDSASYADSPTSVAAAVHLLSTLATASGKGARRRLAERDRLSKELDIYW